MLSLVRLLKRLWDESQGAFTYEHENPLFPPRSPTKTHAFLFNVSARIPFHLIQVARENFPSVDIINLNQSKSTNTLLGNHLSPAEESTFETKKAEPILPAYRYACSTTAICSTSQSQPASPFHYSIIALGNVQWYSD